MGGRNPVNHRAAKLLLVLLLGAAAPAFAEKELVLIVSAHSSIEQVDSAVMRKLFLGLSVSQNGLRLRPVLNNSDPQMREVFLQNIVSMSDSTYDRYILRLALQQGRSSPVAYTSNAELLNAVAADGAVVGYAWASDVAHDSRLRILRVVWHE